ncbi:CDC45-like protein [Eremomyces bilateralis CBS 781.70]|uniref:CDC45-like protein n=1 Tax=Eremomyces bilateralis CBS 781.70 TaxID=1392243 RepID=A0A6G1G747_9PEZI|nr:CDC45-like protein [Eremomyces bilateralis CBS 781.70]KAF1813756.1 CDC45-like protein [Eremomyces bilateralis CBS 781.70]
MYLPRSLVGHLYNHLLRSHHPLSPPVLILVSLEPDAICACRILTSLLRRDYISHKIHPISGYADLANAGTELVRPMRRSDGGSGGVVICLGVGGMVDLEEKLGLEVDENGEGGMGGVEVWVLDARRPYNLTNVFGGQGIQPEEIADEAGRRRHGIDKGQLSDAYLPGNGGIIVLDDGDIEEDLEPEREAYCALAEMPELGDDDESIVSESEVGEAADEDDIPTSGQASRKRKSWSDTEDSELDDDERPRQRRRSNSSTIIPSSPRPDRRRALGSSESSRSVSPIEHSGSVSPIPKSNELSARQLRRQLLRLRQKHDRVLQKYYSLGTSFSEPVSSLLYSLASELGREDNELLWLAIVGVTSLELAGQTAHGLGLMPISDNLTPSSWSGARGARIRAVLRDEVRRLNPADPNSSRDSTTGEASGAIPTQARSPTDNAIRLSPEPRFLLIRHWSLYDSMLHSSYVASKLKTWTEPGTRRLQRLLAKMGVSLTQCRQSYTHMDMELKRGLRERLLKFAPLYGLHDLVPPRVFGAGDAGKDSWGFVRCWGWKACLSASDVGVVLSAILDVGHVAHAAPTSTAQHAPSTLSSGASTPAASTGTHDLALTPTGADASDMSRFFAAYDALGSPSVVLAQVGVAQGLARAILRTGTSLLAKKQIRRLAAFRMCVVREGPDVGVFCRAGPLVKLGLWVAGAVREEGEGGGEMVIAGLDEGRGVFVVVGLGGGSGGYDAERRSAKMVERKKRKEEKEKRRGERRAEREKRREERQERWLAMGEDLEDFEESEDESEEDDSDSDSGSESEGEERRRAKKGEGRNKFGIAFLEVARETGARVRKDGFEHCIVEVGKESLSAFLEGLSFKAVVG